VKNYDPLIFVKQSQLDKAVALIELANTLANDDLINLHLQNAIVEIQRRPTKRAVDEGDSAPLQAESTPEHLSIEEAESSPALRN